MSTPAQFAHKMTKVAGNVQGVPKQILERGALILKKTVQAELAVAAPKGRMNVGKKGQRIGVRYTVGPTSARVFMFGPAHLLERDTKPHAIPRGRVTPTGRVSKRKRKLLSIPGIGVRATAHHPGTKGKHPWRKGLAIAEPLVARGSADLYFGAIRKGLH